MSADASSEHPPQALRDLEKVASLVLGFLESKSFAGAERALRAELAIALSAAEQDESTYRKRLSLIHI